MVTGLRGQPAQEAMTVAGPPGRVEELVAFLEALDADPTVENAPTARCDEDRSRVRFAQRLESGAESHRAREQKARRVH